MTRIDEIRQRLSSTTKLTRLTPDELQKLRGEFPGRPEDYLQFLGEIGFGNLEAIFLYGGPIPPTDIYPRPKGDLSSIVLIGDDFQAYGFGFDVRNHFSMVEVDPRGNAESRPEKDFLSLMESYLKRLD
jgi:hypothetical protein